MRIRLYSQPFGAAEPQVFEAANLAEWLLNRYEGKPRLNVQVFAGEPSAETEISHDAAALLDARGDEYVVLESPGGPINPLMLIAMVVLQVVSQLLAPKPVMPSNVNRSQQSPNNALTDRENKVRLLERVEDIYGTVKSIPSLMMPTYRKYLNHIQYEYGYYCVGRGYYDLTEIRDGDTLIADITGASAAVYPPFESPNSGASPDIQIGDAIIDDVLTVARSIQVDGITLKAANQVSINPGGAYQFKIDGTIVQETLAPAFSSVVEIGDTIDVDVVSLATAQLDITCTSYVSNRFHSGDTPFDGISTGDVINVSGFSASNNNGLFTVSLKVGNNLYVSPEILTYENSSAATFEIVTDYSGTYTVTGVSDDTLTIDPDETTHWDSQLPAPIVHPAEGETPEWTEYPFADATIAVVGKTHITDWVTLPAADRTEVWANILAPNGMYRDDGGGKITSSVSFTVEIEQLDSSLDPLGVVETVTGTLSGATQDERADTVEHVTAWTGPARVRAYRTTAYDYGFEGTIQDEIKWADLYSVSPIDKTEFGNKTTIHTITRATARATAVKTRQLNCIASRLLPTFNGTAFSGAFDADGLHVSGTLNATSKICDIIAAVSIDPKIGRRDLATDVDMAQLWATQQLLDAWNTECGQFNFTFDSDNASYEETVIQIANAGFCTAYRQNGKIRLAFDRAQSSSVALFCHRNKKPRSETITRKFASESEYDGVEFLYSDPDTQQQETIKLPDDGATKYKRFEIPGIRSFAQAWLRANREYKKILGQRITIETVTTPDARNLLPNARISIVDNTRFKSFDGEVINQAGLSLTLSRDVEFGAGAHSIVLMKRDGSLQSIACTAGAVPNEIILASLPAESIVTERSAGGIRTIFSFAADSAREAQAYLVQEIDISDPQYCTVRAVNYSADYYAADYETIPEKEIVIY